MVQNEPVYFFSSEYNWYETTFFPITSEYDIFSKIFSIFWIYHLLFFFTMWDFRTIFFSQKPMLRPFSIILSIMLSFVIWCNAVKKCLNFTAVNVVLISFCLALFFSSCGICSCSYFLLLCPCPPPPPPLFREEGKFLECSWLLMLLYLVLLR